MFAVISGRPWGGALVTVDHTEPADVVDRLLWREAQQILARHVRSGSNGVCVRCAGAWPCSPRRLAERADAASRRRWNEAWTARHDLHGLRALPMWRADLDWRPAGRPGHPVNSASPFR